MADQLQELIRSLPDSFTGRAAADFTRSVATQVRTQAPSLQGPSNWFDFGEGSNIYSVDKIIKACNELELYGQSISGGGPYKRGSYERNRIITLLGEVYGLMGARVAVNAKLEQSQVELASDITSGIGSTTKWLVAGAVAVVAILLLLKVKK